MGICEYCGEKFEKQGQLGYHVAFFHGTATKGLEQYLNNLKINYNKNPKKCLNCTNVIEYKNRENTFCCQSCSATYSNQKRIKKTRICLFCSKEFKIKNSKQKFCNTQCSGAYRKNVLKEQWLKTGIPGNFTGGKSGYTNRADYVIKTILEDQNNCCAICHNINVWEGKHLIFILDHIDGDCTNNTRGNLRLLCSNCNSQTETFAGRNRGKGRSSKGFTRK